MNGSAIKSQRVTGACGEAAFDFNILMLNECLSHHFLSLRLRSTWPQHFDVLLCSLVVLMLFSCALLLFSCGSLVFSCGFSCFSSWLAWLGWLVSWAADGCSLQLATTCVFTVFLQVKREIASTYCCTEYCPQARFCDRGASDWHLACLSLSWWEDSKFYVAQSLLPVFFQSLISVFFFF